MAFCVCVWTSVTKSEIPKHARDVILLLNEAVDASGRQDLISAGIECCFMHMSVFEAVASYSANSNKTN